MTDQRDRGLAAILAGLRLLQLTHIKIQPLSPEEAQSIFDIASDMGTFLPLHTEEIEALCQRLNTEWELMHSDLDTCQERVKESARE